jgi:5'-nucleotidase
MNRKDFIKKSLVSGAGIALLPSMAFDYKKSNFTKITILHTNDVHSHIDPFPENDAKYPGMGGVSKRAWLINQIRNEEKNVLLFDSGDIFQGTPYFNKYGGELEFKLMSAMQYDAATIGNHDFDNGIDGLDKMLIHAKFPFINVNYDFSKTVLNNKVSNYKVFQKDNVKVGVFGLGVELDGLVLPQLYKETRYLNPIEKAIKTSEILKTTEKCDLIICLSHLGYEYNSEKVSDRVLANEVPYIDIILGGHTHTFLDKSVTTKNSENKTMICQAGWAGLRLGRVDCWVERKNQIKEFHSNNIIL